jgi:hypothetical protein
MRIKIQSGPRKGEIQDLQIAAARSMIADGRAVLAVPDQFPEGAFPGPQASTEPAKAAVKKRAKAS